MAHEPYISHLLNDGVSGWNRWRQDEPSPPNFSMPIGRTIRFFLSSTFIDFQVERNILQERVFPELRRFCAQSGFRLQPIDLRWGVSEEAATDRQTLAICFDELDRCRRLSPDFFLLILLGDRYGSHILPQELPTNLVTDLLEHCSPIERQTFASAYRLDENATPPQYVLLPSEGFQQGEDEHLRRTLLWAADEAQVRGQALLPLRASATHREIQFGMLDMPEDDDRVAGVLCAVRQFDRRPHELDASRWVESEEARLVQLQDLHAAIRKRLPSEQVGTYTVACPDGREPVFDEEALAAYFLALLRPKLAAVIATRLASYTSALAAGQDEIALANAHFEQQRADYVIGRQVEAGHLRDYLEGRSGDGWPLVITGAPGSGKSTLLAAAAMHVAATQPEAVRIVRYVGVTPHTGTLMELLSDLRQTIAQAYGHDIPSPIYDESELVTTVAAELAQRQTPPAVPLLVLVDALDQLTTISSSRTDWLPKRLAPHIHIVVSVAEDHPMLAETRTHLPPEQILSLGPLSVADGHAMLHHLLAREPRRMLTHDQFAAVQRAFIVEGRPLYLRLLAAFARRWHSFDVPTLGDAALPETIPSLQERILTQLESPRRHGHVLVDRALGTLAATPFGLAEDELLDVLARDPSVRAHQRHLSPTSPPINEYLPLPVALWVRLYADIEPLLSECLLDGVRLVTFYHHQFRQTVVSRYLAGGDLRFPAATDRHRTLANYFAGQPWRPGPHIWNWRKVRELITQQEAANDWGSAQQSLIGLAEVIEQTQVELMASGQEIDQDNLLHMGEIVDVMLDHVTIGGHRMVGQRFYLLLLASVRRLRLRGTEGAILNNLGVLASNLGRPQDAGNYYQQALIIARQDGNRKREGSALNNLGVLAADRGQLQEAIGYYQEVLAIARTQGDRTREASALTNLGNSARRLGRTDEAERYFVDALAISREIDDRTGEGTALVALGSLADDLGQAGEAERYYRQALGIQAAINDRAGMSITLHNLGMLLGNAGRLQEARECFAHERVVAHEIGDRVGEGSALSSLGALAARLGQAQEAGDNYQQALVLLNESQARAEQGFALHNLGLLAEHRGQREEAIDYLERAIAAYEEVGDSQHLQEARAQLTPLVRRQRGRRRWWRREG